MCPQNTVQQTMWKNPLYLIVEFLLEGGGEIGGHLPDGVACSITDSGVLETETKGQQQITSGRNHNFNVKQIQPN